VATLHPTHRKTPELLRVNLLPSHLQPPIRCKLCPSQMSHFGGSLHSIWLWLSLGIRLRLLSFGCR
jgi:hypothetical protein